MGGKGSGKHTKGGPTPKSLLKRAIPIKDIFEPDEEKLYEQLVDVFLDDFDADELSAGDIDDIMSLCMNRVLEVRLLKSSKGDVDQQVDTSASIEKLRKENNKLKDNLLTRRKDRVNPNEFKGFSIVDLAVAFDKKKKQNLLEKAEKMKEQQKAVLAKRESKGYTGNRYDKDVQEQEEVDEAFI